VLIGLTLSRQQGQYVVYFAIMLVRLVLSRQLH